MTRRQWLALGGAVCFSSCGPKKGTGFPGYALIATSGDKSLAVVDLTAFRLIKSIPLGAEPTAVISGGLARHSYVLTPSTGTVHVLDADLKVSASRRLAGELSELRLTSDRKLLLTVARSSRELIEADASSLRVLKRHHLRVEPASLDVPPLRYDGQPSPRYAAVGTGKDGGVYFFDLQTGRSAQTHLAGEVGAIRFRADAQLLLASNLQDSSLSALSVPALDRIADLPLAMKPENLCFNSDQGQLFITGAGMDGVAIVFPYNTLEVDQTVLAGRDPGVMACSANPAYLFVGSNQGSDVCILDIDTRRVIGIVDVGQQPTYITVTPDNQYALVLDESSGNMGVIHIPALAASSDAGYNYRRKAGASLFTMLPVGERPVHAAVVPRAS